MRRVLLQLVLAALLLFAQQAAVTHAIWHAAENLPGNGSDTGLDRGYGPSNDEHSPQAQLCGFDAAFGQVLGGAHGSAGTFLSPELTSEPIALSARPCSGVLSLSFHSRAPPVLL